MNRLRMLGIILLLCQTAVGQSWPSGVSDQPLVNGNLTPVKQFTVLLITAEYPSQEARYLRSLIENPSREMKPVMTIAYFQELSIQDPSVREKHADIINEVREDRGQLPIIALVDDDGGRWGTYSAPNLPGNEYDLANLLKTSFAAGVRARRQAVAEGREPPDGPTNPVRFLSDAEAESLFSNSRSIGGPFTPTIRPNIVPPEGGLNARLDTSAIAMVDAETRNWLLLLALIIAGTCIVVAHMIGRAITDRPEDVDEIE